MSVRTPGYKEAEECACSSMAADLEGRVWCADRKEGAVDSSIGVREAISDPATPRKEG
jgi:hypothetical protein